MPVFGGILGICSIKHYTRIELGRGAPEDAVSNKNLVDIKKIKYLLFNAKGDNKVKIIGAGEAVSGRGKKSVGILS